MKQIVTQMIILKLGTSKKRDAWLIFRPTLWRGSCILAGDQGNTGYSSNERVIQMIMFKLAKNTLKGTC